MSTQTNLQGILLWIDDDFTDDEIDQIRQGRDGPAGLWERIFGSRTSRLYRLLDLSLVVARSYEEAVKEGGKLSGPGGAGTHEFAIVDLSLPERMGSHSSMKWGICTALELQRQGLPFVFLSRKSDASAALAEDGLATVPYYVKEPELWHLPDALADFIIDEFRTHVAWLSLADVWSAVEPASAKELRPDDRKANVVDHYPYFGAFRTFVDRWELRSRVDLPHIFAVRAARDDSRMHILQSLAVMLHEWFLRVPGKRGLFYAHLHNVDEMTRLDAHCNDHHALCVLRVDPDHTTPPDLEACLKTAKERLANTVVVLPGDETADRYSELLARLELRTIEEIPYVRRGDGPARQELATRASSLALHLWARGFGTEMEAFGRRWLAFASHPELLINPIHWMALTESDTVAEELSDPFEIILATWQALEEATGDQREALSRAVLENAPVDYAHLLRVGRRVLEDAHITRDVGKWSERALDSWLHSSWQYPYGIAPRGDQEASRCEDNAYEVLDGLCRELPAVSHGHERRPDLARVQRFVRELGGRGFVTGEITPNWESLETMRWPHQVYPMPRAVSRRLRNMGRNLWIQPEGMDLAAALPAGRLRYRGLSEIASFYWDVLTWAETAVPELPDGWRESVAYLTDIVRQQRLAEVWPEPERREEGERRQMWDYLLGLAHNAAPIMFIADQTIRNRKLVGADKECTDRYLRSVKGSGKILERLRGKRPERLALYHVPTLLRGGGVPLQELMQQAESVRRLRDAMGDAKVQRWHEIADAALDTLLAIADPEDTGLKRNDRGDSPPHSPVMAILAGCIRGCELWKADGWYRDNLDVVLGDSPLAKLPTVFGTKVDYLWQLLDVLGCLGHATYRYRYCDGYHLLGAIDNLRLTFKDMGPNVNTSTMAVVMDLFLCGIQGLVSHLSWCLRLAGHTERADRLDLAPGAVTLVAPEGFVPPATQDLDEVLRVLERPDGYAVYTLGIPGKESAPYLCYQQRERVERFAAC